jgi:hypothetical protein
VNFVSGFFLWIAPIFGIFTKSPVPVRRVAWFSVPCWIAYLLEPQLYRNFRILGVTDFFGFSSPQKKTSRRLRSFERIFYYEDLLLDPFQRIRRVPCFSGLLFFFSTGVSSGLNGSRTDEPRRTPKDDAGGSGQIVPEYHIAPTGTEPPFCSCRVSPSLKAAAVFRQGDNVPSFASLPSLSVAYFVLCVCVIWNSNFFLTILFVNPTPVNLELRFNSIPFVLRSHRACTSIVGGSREFHF